VTLSQCHTLLDVLIPGQALSVPSLGRRTQAAGEKSGSLLEVFDEYARQRVRDGAADEIYVRAPALMVVEQESLCWVCGRLSEQVSGEAWSQEFFAAAELGTSGTRRRLGVGQGRGPGERPNGMSKA